jgi:class 3 adenylate cyclase
VVTLVFTDIEGSTRLLGELGEDGYRAALAEHRRMLRGAFGRFGGYEVDSEGDAFFYAFADAGPAVAAVREAVDALTSGPIRIRVGVHTGTPGLDPAALGVLRMRKRSLAPCGRKGIVQGRPDAGGPDAKQTKPA